TSSRPPLYPVRHGPPARNTVVASRGAPSREARPGRWCHAPRRCSPDLGHAAARDATATATIDAATRVAADGPRCAGRSRITKAPGAHHHETLPLDRAPPRTPRPPRPPLRRHRRPPAAPRGSRAGRTDARAPRLPPRRHPPRGGGVDCHRRHPRQSAPLALDDIVTKRARVYPQNAEITGRPTRRSCAMLFDSGGR